MTSRDFFQGDGQSTKFAMLPSTPFLQHVNKLLARGLVAANLSLKAVTCLFRNTSSLRGSSTVLRDQAEFTDVSSLHRGHTT